MSFIIFFFECVYDPHPNELNKDASESLEDVKRRDRKGGGGGAGMNKDGIIAVNVHACVRGRTCNAHGLSWF